MEVVDNNGNPISDQNSKRIIAGILGILFGGIGIHKFILNYTQEGVIMLLVSAIGFMFTCGISLYVMSIIGFIEGIIYLTKSDDEFIEMYQTNKKGWF